MKFIKNTKINILFQTFFFTIIFIIKHITKIFYYLLRFRMVKIYLFFLFLKLYKENNFFMMKIIYYFLTITNYFFSKLRINILFECFAKEIFVVANFYKENLMLQTRFFIIHILKNLLTDPVIIDFIKTQMNQIIVETMIQQKKDEYTQMILYSTSESFLKYGLKYLIGSGFRFGFGNDGVYQTITNDPI